MGGPSARPALPASFKRRRARRRSYPETKPVQSCDRITPGESANSASVGVLFEASKTVRRWAPAMH